MAKVISIDNSHEKLMFLKISVCITKHAKHITTYKFHFSISARFGNFQYQTILHSATNNDCEFFEKA